MKRRTKTVLLVAGALVIASAVTVSVLTSALAKVIDPKNNCDTGFSKLVECRYHWSSRTISQGKPAIPSSTPIKFQPTRTETTSLAIAECPQNYVARRLLCATAENESVQAASDDSTSGLPRPKPWFVTTAKKWRFLDSLHVETPLGLAAVLGFYRDALGKRGWTENGGAIIEPDKAVIAFTTKDGPALLRLNRREGRTIADLSLRKPEATSADIQPAPGQTRLRLDNTTDQAAVITINGQTIELAAQAGSILSDSPETGAKSAGSAEINLPPGKYKVAYRIADRATQARDLEIAADETWGLQVDKAGILLPVRLY